uniref:ribonuclease H n=1 Tax=Latimeria chalumnae TaxID=7897 RepID=H3A6Q2_LATCH
YPIPQEAVPHIQQVIDSLLQQSIIRPCRSICNSPIWPVRKPNGSWRLTIDYRRLNSVTPAMAPVVADITQLTTKLQPTFTHFTVLDISNGFWSLPLHSDCQYKFAFSFEGVQYTWNCLPQGFHNSPALFHLAMKQALKSFPFPSNLIQYVDDLLLASADFTEHLQHLEALLQCLQQAGLKVNPDEAQLCLSQVSFLGVTLSSKGRSLDQHKLRVILSLPLPTDVTSLRSFLGMCNFMRMFVYDFAAICKPLYSLFKTDTPFNWQPIHTEAVTSLKLALTSAPVLMAPDYSLPFHLFFSFSFPALAAVLMEQKYTLCEMVLLTAHWALQHFLYLTG